jgi:hypothetical protein
MSQEWITFLTPTATGGGGHTHRRFIKIYTKSINTDNNRKRRIRVDWGYISNQKPLANASRAKGFITLLERV